MGKFRKQRGGEGVSAGAPLSYFDASYKEPSAPAGHNVGNPVPGFPLIVRSGLPVIGQQGGFYPSVMGGVVQNAGLLIPVAARQGMNLFSKYKKTRKTRKSRKSRNTRKARKQTRKSRRAEKA